MQGRESEKEATHDVMLEIWQETANYAVDSLRIKNQEDIERL